jgi:hypothetical protein
MYCTVDVWFRFPVLVTVIVAVCDSSSMYVADENCTDAVTGVPVGVGLGLTLGDGVGVAGEGDTEGVGEGVPQAPSVQFNLWPPAIGGVWPVESHAN